MGFQVVCPQALQIQTLIVIGLLRADTQGYILWYAQSSLHRCLRKAQVTSCVMAPLLTVPESQDVKENVLRIHRLNVEVCLACGTRSHNSGITGWDPHLLKTCMMSTDGEFYGTDNHSLKIQNTRELPQVPWVACA